MANPELGAKQVCPNCQAKFYDLNRRPAHCPKCDTEFDPVRTPRKAREQQVMWALHEGRPEDVEGLTRIEAPPGVHVVDHVTKHWMALEPRPLTLRLELDEADRPAARK